MASESIIWTVLPHGASGEAPDRFVNLSVFVSPRIDAGSGGGALSLDAASFPTFADWTQRIASALPRFMLTARTVPSGQQEFEIEEFSPVALDLKPELWRALFGGITMRSASVRDFAESPFSTPYSGTAFESVRNLYVQGAIEVIAPGTLPPDDTLDMLHSLRNDPAVINNGRGKWRASSGNVYDLLSPEAARRAAFDEAVVRRDNRRAGNTPPIAIEPIEVLPVRATNGRQAGEDSAVDLANVLAFHDQAELNNRAQESIRTFDLNGEFNERIAALGSFPEVLRRLGLLFDLQVPVDMLTENSLGSIRVKPILDPPITATPITPWTSIDFTTFWPYSAADSPLKIDRGFLAAGAPGPGRVELVPIDLNGGVLKLAQAPTNGAAAETGRRLPTLRTSGIALAREGQARLLHRSAARAIVHEELARNQPDDLMLHADEVIRGYRVDVWSATTGKWLSLHELERNYRLTETGISWDTTEEGFSQTSAAVGSDAETGMEMLLVDDSLVCWRGWSLSAERPAGSVAADESVVNPRADTVIGPLVIRQQARRGSLPRLRFGERYRFRVRTVDLAGNSQLLSIGDSAMPPFSILPPPPDTYTNRRYEPVDTPIMVPRQRLLEGETPERIVLRRSLELTASEYSQQHPAYVHAAERHIVPAKTNQFVAELYGRFDAAFGATAAAQAQTESAYEVAVRDRFSLDDPIPGATELIAVGDEGVGYTVHSEASLKLPYLPDPSARGVALRNLPGLVEGDFGEAEPGQELNYHTRQIAGNATRLAFGTDADWPNTQPFRVELVEAPVFGPPDWDSSSRVLKIPMPAGEQITVGLRSFLDAATLQILGIWEWAEEWIKAHPGFEDNPERRQLRATAGDYWFLTPDRQVALVHAVEKPLLAPVLSITPTRELNKTHVALTTELNIHSRSTARIDLRASWQDRIDRVTEEPVHRSMIAHVRAQEIAMHRGATDWTDPDRVAGWNLKDRLFMTGYGAREGHDQPGAVSVTPEGSEIAPPPSDLLQPLLHEFGDTRYRQVTYEATATTRFRDAFPAEVTNDAARITQKSAPVQHHILNSARPSPPAIRYAVPAFKWTVNEVTPREQERRREGGIRLYLERPWFTSGDGEKLAVVMWAGTPDWPPLLAAQASVTRWGVDPIWKSITSSTDSAVMKPAAINFPGRLTDPDIDGRLFTLPGFDTREPDFAIAVHGVAFPAAGAENDFCTCDIQVDFGPVYSPFVRLAVARYQHFSVEHAHLSAAVLSDFMQVSPNRTVTLTPSSTSGSVLGVTVSGDVVGQALAGSGTSLLPSNAFEIVIERRIEGTVDELGWAATSLTGQSSGTPPPGALWHGTVQLPSPLPVGEFRLVVREFEHLATDPDGSSGQRLIFADTVPLA